MFRARRIARTGPWRACAIRRRKSRSRREERRRAILESFAAAKAHPTARGQSPGGVGVADLQAKASALRRVAKPTRRYLRSIRLVDIRPRASSRNRSKRYWFSRTTFYRIPRDRIRRRAPD